MNNLSKLWNLGIEIYDACGIPTSNAQKVWLFPYKRDRHNQEITRLWAFFDAVMEDRLSDDILQDVITIQSIGWTKITEGLFLLKPKKYLPLNKVVLPLLAEKGIQTKFRSLDEIKKINAAAKESFNLPFYQLSYEAWLYADRGKKKHRFWRVGTTSGRNKQSVLEEMYENNVVSIGWNDLGDLYKLPTLNKSALQKELIQTYDQDKRTSSRKAGEILNFATDLNRNDYVVAMEGHTVKAIARALDDRYHYDASLVFAHVKPVEWLAKDINDIQISEGLQTTFVELTAKDSINKLQELLNISETKKKELDNMVDKGSLNQILFGPPGTGKTYNSIDKAVHIATGESGNHAENKLIFDQLRIEGQIEFVTFHQGYSYEDFMVGIKPNTDTEQLTFKPHKGIFYRLVERAKANYVAYKNNKQEVKSFDIVFEDLIAPLEKGQTIDIPMEGGNAFTITDVDNGTIRFKKPNGSDRHTLSVDTLKAIVEGKRQFHSGLGAYYKPLVQRVQELQQPVSANTPLKNFVIIIDEINRANISKVFGELITLLEDDKRMGAENALALALPNGEPDFSIPPNVYIIGTMNTADKSIALVDIALRRRFEFEGYYPDYETLANFNAAHSNVLQRVNEAIYTRKKTADFLIGHGYFMKTEPLETILLKKVIPLLMEYFSGRTEEVQSILKAAGINAEYNTQRYIWIINATMFDETHN
ncbi:AAA family ATPase [Olivibacter sp. SDN3]|nr:AAA family ATPase [Olivibacter sp. SDN3]